MSAPGGAPVQLEPEQVADLHARGEVLLVDVREPYEYEAGHVAGARLVPFGLLAQQAETLPRDRPLVFQCRVGARSGLAAQAFRSAGFDAHNMAGGLVAWVDRGLPLEPEDGRVAEH
jgi:hydroxyacylglutathione hydrolase/adenylyltransferase/sulfurtransferase